MSCGNTGVEERPVPPGYERRQDDEGRAFWAHHATKSTSYEDPRAHAINYTG